MLPVLKALASDKEASDPEAGGSLPRYWGVCFRSQRLRLDCLIGEFSDGFLTVVAATAML